ncbi:unnamed protein product, partial [Coregonus sp. 'balchen']
LNIYGPLSDDWKHVSQVKLLFVCVRAYVRITDPDTRHCPNYWLQHKKNQEFKLLCLENIKDKPWHI